MNKKTKKNKGSVIGMLIANLIVISLLLGAFGLTVVTLKWVIGMF